MDQRRCFHRSRSWKYSFGDAEFHGREHSHRTGSRNWEQGAAAEVGVERIASCDHFQ